MKTGNSIGNATGKLRQVVAFTSLIAACTLPLTSRADVVTVGIGTQDTTTNTVTGGVVIKEMGFLQKELAKVAKYKGTTFKINWQNFTSGPPVTNGMMANTLQIGMMGDYPLLVNGAVFQNSDETKSRLIGLIAYNRDGSGNGIVVRKDSPYYELKDLKGKKISVPFGSAAHGMLLKALEDNGWTDRDFQLSSQSPEVGTSSLQEGRIDAHADFVPFADLLPFRGWARKIYDGAETKVPTFHGVVVREDFAKKYPDFVVAYLKALMDANDWVRKNPVLAAKKIEEWTHIEKEVVYLYLGPGGVHTLDPTIKPEWIKTVKYDHGVLKRMGRVKPLDADAWADDSYIREAFKEKGLDYDKQLASYANYEITGTDPLCGGKITEPRLAGEVWIKNGTLTAYKSANCALAAVKKDEAAGKKIGVTYVYDHSMKIKIFADKAFYAIKTGSGAPEITPFLLKKDAMAYAKDHDATFGMYETALAAAKVGR